MDLKVGDFEHILRLVNKEIKPNVPELSLSDNSNCTLDGKTRLQKCGIPDRDVIPTPRVRS